MTDRNWPAFYYRRAENGGVEDRIFASAEEFAEAGHGWVDTPVKLSEPVPEKVDAKAKLAAAEARVAEIDAELAAGEPEAAPAPAPKTRKPKA
jgi:hypothetical protein